MGRVFHHGSHYQGIGPKANNLQVQDDRSRWSWPFAQNCSLQSTTGISPGGEPTASLGPRQIYGPLASPWPCSYAWRGHWMVTTAPLAGGLAFANRSTPPDRLMKRPAMKRPKPWPPAAPWLRPGCLRWARYGSPIRARMLGGKPGPSSTMAIPTVDLVQVARILTAFSAYPTRVFDQIAQRRQNAGIV